MQSFPELEGTRYEITASLGAGGMGEVYLALDPRLHRKVAVKLVGSAAKKRAVGSERTALEAQAIAKIEHPNVVQIFDVFDHKDGLGIVMEYVRGRTLKDLVEENPQGLKLDTALEFLIQVSSGVDAAHRLGVIHRDLKTLNVMVTGSDEIKILDFGLAKFVGGPPSDITASGAVLGTARSMAPEQVVGKAVDHRADLFALGILAYEILTGRPPFLGSTDIETLDQVRWTHQPSLIKVKPGIDRDLSRLVDELLEKKPVHRPKDAHEVCQRLLQIKKRLEKKAMEGLPEAGTKAESESAIETQAWGLPESKTKRLDEASAPGGEPENRPSFRSTLRPISSWVTTLFDVFTLPGSRRKSLWGIAGILVLAGLWSLWVAYDQHTAQELLLSRLASSNPTEAYLASVELLENGAPFTELRGRLVKGDHENPIMRLLERGAPGVSEEKRDQWILRGLRVFIPWIHREQEDRVELMGIAAWLLDRFPGRDPKLTSTVIAEKERLVGLTPHLVQSHFPESDWVLISKGLFREVPVDEFEISRYEVSERQVAVVSHVLRTGVALASRPGDLRPREPAHINWYRAYGIAALVGGRLPAAAEWCRAARYACREGSEYCALDESGSSESVGRDEVARSREGTPVRPNAAGIFDLYGSVKEWVLDWRSPTPWPDSWGPPLPWTRSGESYQRIALGGYLEESDISGVHCFGDYKGANPSTTPLMDMEMLGAEPPSQDPFLGFRVVRQSLE